MDFYECVPSVLFPYRMMSLAGQLDELELMLKCIGDGAIEAWMARGYAW